MNGDPALVSALRKLVRAGETAGVSIEQMIDLLNSGVSLDALLQLIAARLQEMETKFADRTPVSWVM